MSDRYGYGYGEEPPRDPGLRGVMRERRVEPTERPQRAGEPEIIDLRDEALRHDPERARRRLVHGGRDDDTMAPPVVEPQEGLGGDDPAARGDDEPEDDPDKTLTVADQEEIAEELAAERDAAGGGQPAGEHRRDAEGEISPAPLTDSGREPPPEVVVEDAAEAAPGAGSALQSRVERLEAFSSTAPVPGGGAFGVLNAEAPEVQEVRDEAAERSAAPAGAPAPEAEPGPDDGVEAADRAAEPSLPALEEEEAEELAPDGDVAAMATLLDPDDVRQRWIEIKASFVDEPRQAIEQANELARELTEQVMRMLDNERVTLEAELHQGGTSTEELRLALRRYSSFCDRLLNLTV